MLNQMMIQERTERIMALHYGDTTMQTDIRQDGALSHGTTGQHTIGAAIRWGLLFGGMQAPSPLLLWWLAAGTAYAISLILIAPIYIGFAVADGRPIIIAVESSVAALFVLVAAAAITGPAWLLVIGLVGHALKDLWQHRRQYVAGTRWWAPFCCTVDLVAAALISLAILGGLL
jgi:hypothetical protein